MSRDLSSAVWYAVAVTLGMVPMTVQADDETKADWVYGDIQVKLRGTKSAKTQLRAELGWDSNGEAIDGGARIGVFGKTPAEEDGGSYKTRVDEFSAGWRAGLSAQYEWTDAWKGIGAAKDSCDGLKNIEALVAGYEQEARRFEREHRAAERESSKGQIQGRIAEVQLEIDRLVARERAMTESATTPGTELAATRAELSERRTRLALLENERARDLQASDAADASQAVEKAELEEKAKRARQSLDALRARVGANGIRCPVSTLKREIMWKLRLGATGEMGGAKFAWSPPGEDESDEPRVSGAASLTLDGWFVGRAMTQGKRAGPIGSGRVFAPALIGRYTREWEAQSSVPVSTQGAAGDEVAGELRIVSPPTSSPTFSLRAFLFVEPFAQQRKFALGPSVAVTWAGEKDGSTAFAAANPFDDKTVLRLELWGYAMPIAKPANTRIGVAPFVDLLVKGGRDDEESTEGGVLLTFQVGKPVFRY